MRAQSLGVYKGEVYTVDAVSETTAHLEGQPEPVRHMFSRFELVTEPVTFNVGDKVRNVDDPGFGGLRKGGVYTVAKVRDTAAALGGEPRFCIQLSELLPEYARHFRPARFYELVEAAPANPLVYKVAYVRPDGTRSVWNGDYSSIDEAEDSIKDIARTGATLEIYSEVRTVHRTVKYQVREVRELVEVK
jgi:hypothetical protein